MSGVTILNERHAVHGLVQQHLHRTSTTIHPKIDASIIRFSIACAGVGLDHLAGEQAMAFCDESVRGRFGEYFLFTDRRLLGCFGETRYDVRYSQIRELKVESGIMTRGIFVTHHDGTKTALTFGGLLQPAGAFFTDLTRLPADGREPPPRAPCVPGDADPSGARRALEQLGVVDDRTALMLRYVDAALAAGAMPVEIARDFVTRIVLHHRNVHFGRGMAQGRWISAVSMNDLSNLIVQLFGNPLSVSEQPVRTIELPSNLKSNAVAKAAVSSAIGLASMAVLGVGWVSTARAPIARFKMMVADTGPFASFRLQGPRGTGLERESPELLHRIDAKLLELEDDVLMRRLARGWSEKTPELLAVTDDQIRARIVEILASGKGGSSPRSGSSPEGGPSASAGPSGQPASVHGFVSEGGGMTMEQARQVQQAAQQVLVPTGAASERINAAARLMTSGRYDEAAAEYHAIGQQYPAERGTCWSQVGAALYFLGRYEEAIQWYEVAEREGADAEMMRMNVDEAREAIAKRR